jgi:hypothetical protein
LLFLKHYRELLRVIRYSGFDWIGKSSRDIPIEHDSILTDSHASDLHSLCAYYSLNMSLSTLISRSQSPLPPARMIRPTILVFWNALKGGVDEYSRSMQAFSRSNVSENPGVSVIGRILMSQAANAAVIHRLALARCNQKLPRAAEEAPPHHRGYYNARKRVSRTSSSREFVRRLAEEWMGEKDPSNSAMCNLDLDGEDPGQMITVRLKRKALDSFNSGSSKMIRLDPRREHEMIRLQRRWCDLCSETERIDGKVVRTGKKTNKWCKECRQTLCSSCFVKWHRESRLVKPSTLRVRSRRSGQKLRLHQS